MPAIIYARVSTKSQSTEQQVQELWQVASKAGWNVADVMTDEGISGTKGRDKRPALDEMLRAITQRKADRVMVWSVDRLGRSLQHLIATLNDIKAAGADLYIHQQAIDTSTPAGNALFGMLGVFAEFERAMISDRVISGLEKAKANGKTLGRPRRNVTAATLDEIVRLREEGLSLRKIGKLVGLPFNSVRAELLKLQQEGS
jgi:DNA invertase Pin-like site-specific DNA recombinase